MPIPGARYRVTTTKTGKKIRLAFQGNRVVETKNLKTGAVHSPAEFAADRALKRGRRARLRDRLTELRGSGAFSRRVR